MAGGELDDGGSGVNTGAQTQYIQGAMNVESNTPIYVDSGGQTNRPI